MQIPHICTWEPTIEAVSEASQFGHAVLAAPEVEDQIEEDEG